ncbi:AfsR/SARP family transcriptional regulator [Streptomyces sp. MZ04]|uniref:AfsR/SARP family transcriptional regulator n=1 Tax=Streptomyces sp. MZ04 TaxID=2559236 RepID=UPI00107EA4BF|nr:AfsR/SARP family transcriptional regulator [Streptomyces sp. MZ04]TGA92975.1 AfsR/SARP family transcriptional regulator [Streptomyces sp. MZ04]
MEYRILGQVEVRHEDKQLPLYGAKQRTVLSALLLAGDLVVYDSQLGDYLWGQKAPATMNAQIYTYISRLRKMLGPHARIMRHSPGYQMEIGSAWFDLDEFSDQSQRGHEALAAGDYEQAVTLLSSALSLWRGPALANVSSHLADAVRPQLEEARISALTGRFEAELALGRHASLVPRLTQLVREYPLQERFRAQLMTALYRCDRQADALALYEQGRRILAGSLGVDPGALLHEVMLAILNSDPKLLGPARERSPAGVGRSALPGFAVL